MRKNAGIKSKKEAAQRLIDGEKFIWRSTELFFDEKMQSYPFVAVCKGSTENIYIAFDHFAEWQTEIDWRENIGKGVLCWVWDEIEHKTCGLVIDYKKHVDYPYRTGPCGWKHAEMLTDDEIKEFLNDK